MISKTIQELKYGALWIVPGDQHLVVPIDYGLCCLVPCIMSHKYVVDPGLIPWRTIYAPSNIAHLILHFKIIIVGTVSPATLPVQIIVTLAWIYYI